MPSKNASKNNLYFFLELITRRWLLSLRRFLQAYHNIKLISNAYSYHTVNLLFGLKREVFFISIDAP